MPSVAPAPVDACRNSTNEISYSGSSPGQSHRLNRRSWLLIVVEMGIVHETKRQTILRLLAEEEAKLASLTNTPRQKASP